MIVETENLIKVSTYAKETGVTPRWIWKKIEKKKIKEIVIDGVKFIDKTTVDKTKKNEQ